MQEAPHAVRHTHDIEKDEVAHLEQVSTRSPPGEVEKGQPLAGKASNGPVVHDKVRTSRRLCSVALTCCR